MWDCVVNFWLRNAPPAFSVQKRGHGFSISMCGPSARLAELIKPLPACLTGAPCPVLISPGGGALPRSLAQESHRGGTQRCFKLWFAPGVKEGAGLWNTSRPSSQVNVPFSFISPFHCPNRANRFPSALLFKLHWDQLWVLVSVVMMHFV